MSPCKAYAPLAGIAMAAGMSAAVAVAAPSLEWKEHSFLQGDVVSLVNDGVAMGDYDDQLSEALIRIPATRDEAYDISFNLAILEKAGDGAIWAGCVLRPASSVSDTNWVYVIYESADGEGYAGLRIHEPGRTSPLLPLSSTPGDVIELSLSLDAADILAVDAINSSTGEEVDSLRTELPILAPGGEWELCYAASAQHSYGFNPRVAFGLPTSSLPVFKIRTDSSLDAFVSAYTAARLVEEGRTLSESEMVLGAKDVLRQKRRLVKFAEKQSRPSLSSDFDTFRAAHGIRPELAAKLVVKSALSPTFPVRPRF